ncbi:MAG: peptidoglycan-binding domain-containing protein [bacterium]|nr:peptidoglycan-binding domain-containing protein [bacterium]
MMQNIFKTKFFFSFLFFSLLVLGSVFAIEAKAQTETQSFYIDSSYDLYARKEIEAVLIRTTGNLYFYVEKSWWESRSSQEQNNIRIALFDLGEEFKNKIYPVLTSTFGSEWKPGIDNNERIAVLVHEMGSETGGYFRNHDQYYKLQVYNSNEREMVYLNSRYIDKPEAKSFLAHEFVHLITVNQKDLLRGVTEEVWLNEARAEYAPTLLGYDDVYKGSNLETRVRNFLENPNDSLTEWLNRKEDYGALNLFTQYLVDHYGVKVLVESLQSNKTGIDSLNYALKKNGFKNDFSQVFADWTIAVLVNDCKLGERYCYLNKNLKDLRITPTFYYLPKTETILSTYYNTTYWSAIWHRFIGGESNLALEFDGADSVGFEVPYLLCDFKDNCSVGFFSLAVEQKGKITFSEFSTKYSSLTIMPFIKSKISGFSGREDSFSFSWKVSVQKESGAERETELISQLLAQIEELKRQIAEVQAKINVILAIGNSSYTTCFEIKNNLYFGIRDNQEVSCLQEFLKSQGPAIYPEALVTGNFLSLTRQAVIRFQEKHATEILAPLGLQKGTGYVGPATRAKIDQFLNF